MTAASLAAGCAVEVGERSGASRQALTGGDIGIVGAGFAGIAVALIGRNHPVGIALASLL